MSNSAMDLDSPLDDLIRKRKQEKPQRIGNNNNQKNTNQKSTQNNNSRNRNKPRPTLNLTSSSSRNKITKTTPGINARLSTAVGKNVGPLFTAKNKSQSQPQKTRQNQVADPSQILITKIVSTNSSNRRNNNSSNNSTSNKKIGMVLSSGKVVGNGGISSGSGSTGNGIGSRIAIGNSRFAKGGNNTRDPSILNSRSNGQQLASRIEPVIRAREEQEHIRSHVTTTGSAEGMGSFSIRGRSSTAVRAKAGLTIKGESGPTTVLLHNLDPGVNSEDLRLFLGRFGHVLNCEVFRDLNGNSFREAEVEFSTKEAALSCIDILDNKPADGYIMRVILREGKSNASYPAKQIRSVISTPSYTSGKMYADHIEPRYSSGSRY